MITDHFFYQAKMAYKLGRTIEEPSDTLEMKIFETIARADEAFVGRRFNEALRLYLLAWNMMPLTVWPWLPVMEGVVIAETLLDLELTPYLVKSSAQAMESRLNADGKLVGKSALTDPLPTVFRNKIAAMGFVEPESYAKKLDAAIAFITTGEWNQAQRLLNSGLRQTGDEHLRARFKLALAAVDLKQGDVDRAISSLEALRADAARGDPPRLISAVTCSLHVAHARRSELTAPAASTAAEIALMGATTSEREITLVDSSGHLVHCPMDSAMYGRDHCIIRSGSKNVPISTGSGALEDLRKNILESRREAASLGELDFDLHSEPQIIAYLAHIGGFVLPLCIGDTYAALGNRTRAREYYNKCCRYQYLNLFIEKPMVWARIARTFIEEGAEAYKEGSDESLTLALDCFARIARINGDSFTLAGELYSGLFSGYASSHKNFLESGQYQASTGLDPERRMLLAQAVLLERQLLAGLDYFGQPPVSPIHTWRHLQNLARYFANEARYAERSYINFRDAQEREESTALSLLQNEELQKEVVKVETRNRETAAAQVALAAASKTVVDERLTAANNQFLSLSAIKPILVNLALLEAQINGSKGFAITGSRTQLNYDMELQSMKGQIGVMQKAQVEAAARVALTNASLESADAQLVLAGMRANHAAEQKLGFTSQEFTPETWMKLADRQRETAGWYVDKAIGAAKLMERAFEAEYDIRVRNIKNYYGLERAGGLLAADELLMDIDQFAYDRVHTAEKQLPVKTVISLADRYPRTFTMQFNTTGRIDFDTRTEDFDAQHPGLHLRKIKRIEVKIEGALDPSGVTGFLRNTGVSWDRNREGDIRIRMQRPEVLPLSLYDYRQDGFLFATDEALLDTFENTGVAGSWTLELLPSSPGIDFGAVCDIKVVFYYDAYYSDSVASAARAHLAAADALKARISYELKSSFPDEFFELQSAGTVVLPLEVGFIPPNHLNPVVSSFALLLRADQQADIEGLSVRIGSPDITSPVIQPVDANGAVSSDPELDVPINGLVGMALDRPWTIEISQAENRTFFTRGFKWEQISHMYLSIEYRYVPRGHPCASTSFAASPMADFQGIDHPSATEYAPSSWQYANKRLLQIKRIRPPAGAKDYLAGTFLIRKTTNDWPELRNLFLNVTLGSNMQGGALGLVLRFESAQNHLLLSLDKDNECVMLARIIDGAAIPLASFDAATPFTPGENHELKVAAVDTAITVFLDGTAILNARDKDAGAPGKYGLYCRNNPGAFFSKFMIRGL